MIDPSSEPPAPPTLLRARWVAPMVPGAPGALLADGCVVMTGGAIAAVGAANELGKRFPNARIHDAGSAVILPGLVNAHVHLELSNQVPGPPPARFVDWVMALIRRTAGAGTDEQSQASAVADAIRTGVAQCLRFGVTAVGDISRLCRLTRPLLRCGPLRVVSYGEVAAMGQRRGLLEERLALAVEGADPGAGRDVSAACGVADDGRSSLTTHKATPLRREAASGNSGGGDSIRTLPRLRIGVSPHAPYSIEPEGYRRCIECADRFDLPLATHLAETPDEAAFLRDHAGPFRELWEFLGAWDNMVPRFAGGPIRLMHELGLIRRPAALAHVNYCNDSELSLLSAAGPGGASVIYCPRTHAFFGHPPHRWREMLARGINVAVGTDSCASSPDLNLVDDLRLLRRLAPEVPVGLLWEMATVRSAQAIGIEAEAGSLAPGKAADCVVFPAKGDDPLSKILDENAEPREVWIGGNVVR